MDLTAEEWRVYDSVEYPESCSKYKTVLGGSEEGEWCPTCKTLSYYCNHCQFKGKLVEMTMLEWHVDGKDYTPPYVQAQQVGGDPYVDDGTTWDWKCPECDYTCSSCCD